ncbi:DUF86 domain-containing protein [Nocardioides sp.]|uniref:HepT-like ribonuclease domain-containing protein n=1 Tax=Nocardioides sp. TaxID=35761 RepID=UPI0039E3A5F7
MGEAAKALPEELTASESEIPWRQIARMRDHLAHRYFMTELEILQDAIENDLGPLQDAVNRMRTLLTSDEAEDADTGQSESAD